MGIVLVTGSGGLIGSESVSFFIDKGFQVVGIDNDMRQYFYGKEASTKWNIDRLCKTYENKYIHYAIDIRDDIKVNKIFRMYNEDIVCVIHTAAQPSHDWAVREPYTDFTINANGTLVMLENTRQNCPEASFIFCSTSKVYGDNPNKLPFVEQETRYELEKNQYYYRGIDETMSIDHCKHSLFGASKVAADILVQEYGRYFGMKTVCFRGGCLTGPNHSGAPLHGFLSYLMKCCMTGDKYQILGYKGKQVRDNIHSYDLVNAFYHFSRAPRIGEVYNIGGSRFSNCSILEAASMCEIITGKKLNGEYIDTPRIGDHIWWIDDITKFKSHYPEWNLTYDIFGILRDIYDKNTQRWY